MNSKKPSVCEKPFNITAWVVQHKVLRDISDKLFITEESAKRELGSLPFKHYKVIEVEIRPKRKRR